MYRSQIILLQVLSSKKNLNASGRPSKHPTQGGKCQNSSRMRERGKVILSLTAFFVYFSAKNPGRALKNISFFADYDNLHNFFVAR